MEASRNLATLVSYRGRDRVREILGVDDAILDGLLDGSTDWPEDAWEKFQRPLDNLRTLGYAVETPDEAGPADAGEPEGGDDADAAGEPDANGLNQEDGDQPRGRNSGHDVETVEAGEGHDQGAGSWRLWVTRELAITRFFRGGLPMHVQLAALTVVVQLESRLIALYREAPTELGARWDGDRQERELKRRTTFQSRVRAELAQMHTGLRGIANWSKGRSRIDLGKLERELLDAAAGLGPGYDLAPVIALVDFLDQRDAHPLVQEYLSWHVPRPDRRRR